MKNIIIKLIITSCVSLWTSNEWETVSCGAAVNWLICKKPKSC